MSLQTPFRLGNYLVTPLEHSVCYMDDECRALQPKFIEVLAYLAAQYPRLVTREELIEAIWNGNGYVGEKALTNAVWNLRKALNCDDVLMIETIRKTGYRLLVEPSFISTEVIEQQAIGVEPKRQHNIKPYALLFVAVISVLVTFMLWISQTHDHQKGVELRNLTSAPGRELFPSISHDQRYLLYSWRQINHPSDLFIKDLTQPDLSSRQLTFTQDSEGSAIWGKDSESVFFVRKNWSKTKCQIIQLSLDTLQESVVDKCPTKSNIYLSLSSDSNTLAYTGTEKDYGVGIYFKNLEKPNSIPTRFSCTTPCGYSDRSVAFSPNGVYLAVSRRIEEQVEDIYLVNLSDKSERQLTFGEGDIKGMAWSGDSSKLIFASKNSLSRSGSVININNGIINSLNIEGFSFPAVIPGSNDLVFHHWSIPAFISYMPLDGETTATPFPMIQSGFSHTSAHYSDVNKKVAYVSNESGFNEIWIAKTDGSSRKRLTNLKNNLTAPRWSHDGKYIAFLATLTDKQSSKIYILDMNSLSVRELKTDFDIIYRPTWSIDSKSIIAAAQLDDKSRLYRIPLDTGSPIRLTNTSAKFAIETEDNKIWYVRGGSQGLWKIDSKQSEKPVQVLTKDKFQARYNWTVTKGGVYFQTDLEGHHRIDFFSFKNSEINPIVRLPIKTMNRFGTMSYIEKEQKLIFTQFQYPQVDIKRLSHPLLN